MKVPLVDIRYKNILTSLWVSNSIPLSEWRYSFLRHRADINPINTFVLSRELSSSFPLDVGKLPTQHV